MSRPRSRPFRAPSPPSHADLKALPWDCGRRSGYRWSRWLSTVDGTLYECRLRFGAGGTRLYDWWIVPQQRQA